MKEIFKIPFAVKNAQNNFSQHWGGNFPDEKHFQRAQQAKMFLIEILN